MPYLRLHLSDCRYGLGVGGSRDDWRITWKTGMGWLESVKLSNGSDLAKMSGSLHLTVGTVEGEDKPLGALYYLEAYAGSSDGFMAAEPESYSVEVVVPEPQLLRLLDMAREERGPSNVSVEVEGLGYGYAPDGSDKKWELSEGRNWLPVQALNFGFPSKEDAEAPEEFDDELPVPAGPSAEVQAIQNLGTELGKVLTWVLALLALIALTLMLK